MKTLLTLVAFISLQQAFAQGSNGMTPILEGDTAIVQAPAKILSVRKICEENEDGISCLAIGQIVTVEVKLGGCLDRFAGHVEKLEFVDGEALLHFSALKIANKKSMAAFCTKLPTKIIKVSMSYEGEVRLVKLPYQPTLMPLH